MMKQWIKECMDQTTLEGEFHELSEVAGDRKMRASGKRAAEASQARETVVPARASEKTTAVVNEVDGTVETNAAARKDESLLTRNEASLRSQSNVDDDKRDWKELALKSSVGSWYAGLPEFHGLVSNIERYVSEKR